MGDPPSFASERRDSESWRAFRYIDALLIMAEHPPLLDTAQILSSDISLLSAPIVSADGTQQVILVQVNPGEAFTIRREDGQFQCITGPG